MKRVFIDCGAWLGNSTIHFYKTFPKAKNYQYYAFECNPHLFKKLRKRIARSHINSTIDTRAVWVNDDVINFRIGPDMYSESASIISSKRIKHYIPRNDLYVKCFDFSSWMNQLIAPGDVCVIKMNIEGAEYAVLNKMIKDNTIKKVTLLLISWHYRKINLPESEHLALIEKLNVLNIKHEVWSLEHE